MSSQAITRMLPRNPVKAVLNPWVLCLISTGLGVLLALTDPRWVIVRVVGVACIIAILKQPYYGLIIYLIIEYLRPGDTMSALAGQRPAQLMAVATILAWIIARSRNPRDKIVWASQSWMIAGLMGVMLISTLTAVWKTQAVDAVIDAGKIVVVFFLITNLLTREARIRHFLWVLVFLGLFLAVRSIFLFESTGEFAEGPGEGFLGDRNDLAMAMAVILPIAAAVFQASTKRAHKALAGGTVVAIIYGIISTFSRGGFVGLVVVLFATALVARRRLLAMTTLICLLLVAWVAAPQSYRDRILSIQEYEQDESAQNRLFAWRSARMMFHDRPFFGVGPGNFSTAYGTLYHPEGAPAIWRAPHSIYFECMAELGLAGCLFFGLMLGLTYRDLLRIYQGRVPGGATPWERRMAAGIAVGLLGYMASATFLSALLYSHPYYLAALTIALNTSIRERASREGGGET